MLHDQINRYGKMQINQFSSETNTSGLHEILILTIQNILQKVWFYFMPSFSNLMKIGNLYFNLGSALKMC